MNANEDGEKERENEGLQVVHDTVGDRLEEDGGNCVPNGVHAAEGDHHVHVDILHLQCSNIPISLLR